MSYQLTIRPRDPADLAGKEWHVPNGLGGYASGTLAGGNSRRHDGILVAALDAPYGRTVMLDRLDEVVHPRTGASFPLFSRLAEFRLEHGLPVWRFEAPGLVLERRLVMPYRQNTVHVQYRALENGDGARLELRPWLYVRSADGWLDQPLLSPAAVRADGSRIEMAMGSVPPLRLELRGADFSLLLDGGRRMEAVWPIEAQRYYPDRAPLWSPGTLAADLSGGGAALVASTEDWPAIEAMSTDEVFAAEQERRRRLVAQAHPALRDGEPSQLVLAADAFIFTPRGRPGLAARTRAFGDDIRSVIAGYPWFNDWGRDTMISLEGLTLVTGRQQEARWILSTFAQYVRDGLIPDNVPDGQTEGVYHAADATLWFFHAVGRYVAATGDQSTLALILPKLVDIVDHHRCGTRFNIGVDPADGLLRQGAEGYMLTWMDSATPRRGKAVEINALWYNALRLMEGWLAQAGDREGADRARADADRARESFNRRFWNAKTGFLYDLVDGEAGDDDACRCNQIFTISLPHPILDESRWAPVLDVVRERLLTPFGLRSLSRDAPDYRPGYVGDLGSRDFAYHRGTVWAWLIGPFVDAWLKVNPHDGAGARRILEGFYPHLADFAVGTIAEVFDGDPPHAPRGCIAQAWSVAEWLRAWVRTADAVK
ncbi:MAG: glycogen debranching enzyme N-terminal domain-containing protein [Magnetospirillum sp.]|nr:glycogen debranching enzyme N-terminal domain-containing protein [Magnetospirillum sp.]